MCTKDLSIVHPDKARKLNIGHHSSPIFGLTPGYGKGKTPLWNTFESMEIDFDIGDLSDDEDEFFVITKPPHFDVMDDEDDDFKILQDYNNYAVDDADFHTIDDDKKQPQLKQKKQTMGRSSVPPSAMLSIGASSDEKAVIETPKMKCSASELAPTKSTSVSSRTSLTRCNSVPIRKMKYYEINGLTIWSNHKRDLEELYLKEAISKQHKNTKRKSKKQIKFKDMDMEENDLKCTANSDEKDDNLRRYLIGEIIETEETYVRGLNTLLNEFIIPLFDKKLIKHKYKDILTCNIPEIIKFHTSFLQHLINTSSQRSFETVFYELCNNEFVEMYTKYILQYDNMLDIYAKYNKSKKLQKFFKNKRKEKKPLTNHLILPIQRVTRYLILLEELKKKTVETHRSYTELESVLEKIEVTVNMINERQREIENMSQCLQVQETMNGLNRNIVERHRKLLAQFVFRKKENQRGRQFFLFNDLLIITNLKLKVKSVIEIRTIEIKKIKERNAFHLFSINHEAIYETDDGKSEDLRDLIRLLEDNRQRIHKESLKSVGLCPADIAALLTGKYSFSQGNLARKQIDVQKKRASLPLKVSSSNNDIV